MIKLKPLLLESVPINVGTSFIVIKAEFPLLSKLVLHDEGTRFKRGDSFRITGINQGDWQIICIGGPTKNTYPKEGFVIQPSVFQSLVQKGYFKLLNNEIKEDVSSPALGFRKERVVFEGPNLAHTKDAIIANCIKHDPEAKVQFFPATGKMVGTIAKVKLEFIQRDLKQIDKTATAKIKPIDKALKK